MARAYSQDLRDRVIDAGLSGLPARQTAARFGVGIATPIVWVRRDASGKAVVMRRVKQAAISSTAQAALNGGSPEDVSLSEAN